MVLYFITGNKNKFAEAQQIIPELKHLEINLPEIQDLNPENIIKEAGFELGEELDVEVKDGEVKLKKK